MVADGVRDALFDRWSRTYDDPTLQRLSYRPVHDAVLERVGSTRPSVVLDLGCGTGQFTRRLVDHFSDATVVGVDLSAGMLSEAAAHEDSGTLVRADAMRLPLQDSSVDLAVCTESFHWYPSQDEALVGLRRVLRADGRLLIVSIATITDLGDLVVRRMSGAGGRTIRALPPGRIRRLLEQNGFEVLHQRRVPRAGPFAWPVLTDARLVG